MNYFIVSKIDGRGFFPDEYNGDLFIVEFAQNDGESRSTMSTYRHFEGADK